MHDDETLRQWQEHSLTSLLAAIISQIVLVTNWMALHGSAAAALDLFC